MSLSHTTYNRIQRVHHFRSHQINEARQIQNECFFFHHVTTISKLLAAKMLSQQQPNHLLLILAN